MSDDTHERQRTEDVDRKVGEASGPRHAAHAARFSSEDSHKERRRERERARARARRTSVVRTLLLMLVALAVGGVAGLFASRLVPSLPKIPAGSSPKVASEVSLSGRTTVNEDELDAVMGTYTRDGEVTQVTVRDAILETRSLDNARNEDGTYNLPSADVVLSIARDHFLAEDAQERGITATDEEVSAYLQQTWKTDDLSAIATSYGMDEDQARELVRRATVVSKLRAEVVQTQPVAEPAAPAAPEAGTEDEPMADYASYIMGLVGSEWDGAANTWAGEDGPYYAQLKNYTISNDAATYSAAQAAYQVALMQQAAIERQIASEWTAYVNQVLSEVTVELATAVA